MNHTVEKFLEDPRIHFTRSQKDLLGKMIPEIGLKENSSAENLLNKIASLSFLREGTDPVQKGKKIFSLVRKMRYPLSGGRRETFEGSKTASRGVASLDSRKNLINPYYYGEGVFDLKEYVVSLIRSCPLDCAYCFLREVYDDPRFKISPDYLKMALELGEIRKLEPGPIYLNAGQNADSLILDMDYGIGKGLLNLVCAHRDVFMELRTKTDKIHNILKIHSGRERLVVAFSLNPESDRRVFESNTATIQERCSAISRLGRIGCHIGLRLEPILYTKDYSDKYLALFKQLFSEVEPGKIHSISLGCLRLTKGLAKLLKSSHPRVLAEEWVLCPDDKYRYCRELRAGIYRKLIEMLEPWISREKIVLSTEPLEVWQKSGLPLKTMPELCS